jgi:hypothetical protein
MRRSASFRAGSSAPTQGGSASSSRVDEELRQRERDQENPKDGDQRRIPKTIGEGRRPTGALRRTRYAAFSAGLAAGITALRLAVFGLLAGAALFFFARELRRR